MGQLSVPWVTSGKPSNRVLDSIGWSMRREREPGRSVYVSDELIYSSDKVI